MSVPQKGLLRVYRDPLLMESKNKDTGPISIVFQYNPSEVTRTVKLDMVADTTKKGGDALSVSQEAQEDYAFKLELDATNGIAKGRDDADVTANYGILPQIAVLQGLMHTIGEAPISKGKKKKPSIPPGRIPFTLLVLDQGPLPVRITSLSIHETDFDTWLRPIHASVDVSFKVLLPDDLSASGRRAQHFALDYWQNVGNPDWQFRAITQVTDELVD